MVKINNTMIETIIRLVGGERNIQQCGNCMTRLRLVLNNDELVNDSELKRVPGVLGIVESDDQLQIVLGPGKAQTAAEMLNAMMAERGNSVDELVTPEGLVLDISDVASDQKKQVKAKHTSGVHKFLSKFATIFTPLIPGFIAAGLLLGFATLFEQLFIKGADTPSEDLIYLIGYMKVFSKGLFSFLSILIGYNAQKAFGGSGVNGAIIAALFVLGYDPEATKGFYSGIDSFFGHNIDPRGNIIGVLIAAIVGAKVECFIRRYMPDDLDMILTSFFTLLVMGAVTFVIIMPIGGYLYSGMTWLFLNLNGNPIGSAILAGLFLISVMFGIHQGFVPVYFALMDVQGFNSLFPILAMAGGGQVGAAFALYKKAGKDSLLRTQIKGSIIPGILGIGEPLIYGVTLPRVKPFITACIGGAAGGFYIGLISYFGLPVGLNTVFGPSGIVALPLMTSNSGIFIAMAVYGSGLCVSYAAGFAATYLWGTKDVDLS